MNSLYGFLLWARITLIATFCHTSCIPSKSNVGNMKAILIRVTHTELYCTVLLSWNKTLFMHKIARQVLQNYLNRSAQYCAACSRLWCLLLGDWVGMFIFAVAGSLSMFGCVFSLQHRGVWWILEISHRTWVNLQSDESCCSCWAACSAWLIHNRQTVSHIFALYSCLGCS